MGSDCLVGGVGRECVKQLLSTFNIISVGVLCRLDKARSARRSEQNRPISMSVSMQDDRGHETHH
jgi:hypothetical protein